MEVKENIADEFNEFSKNYTEDMIKCVPHYIDLLQEFTRNLPQDFSPKKILDLGCGNGNTTNTLIKLFPKTQFTLVDASKDMLELCMQRFSRYNINYEQSYFNDFTFKANSYNLITAGFSLHHCNLKEKQKLYKKIFLSLKSKGIFSCSDLMIDKHFNEHNKHLEQWKNYVLNNYPDEKKWNWIIDHYNRFDFPESISNHLKWLKKAGFERFNFNIYSKYWAHFTAFKN